MYMYMRIPLYIYLSIYSTLLLPRHGLLLLLPLPLPLPLPLLTSELSFVRSFFTFLCRQRYKAGMYVCDAGSIYSTLLDFTYVPYLGTGRYLLPSTLLYFRSRPPRSAARSQPPPPPPLPPRALSSRATVVHRQVGMYMYALHVCTNCMYQ